MTGRTKLCTGPAHPGPTRLPLTGDHWGFYRSGARAGTAYGRCKLCRHWKILVVKDGPHGLVPVGSLRLLAVELVERCGNAERAEAAHGITAATLRSLSEGKRPQVRKATALRLLLALSEQRKYDRRNGSSERFLAARRAIAERDERIGRLAGY